MRYLLFVLPLVLSAQTMVLTPSAANTCAATSTTLGCTGKVGDAGGNFTIYPPATLITVTNSGGGTLTWSAAISGTISTACSGPCIRLLQQYNSTAFTSGTAPSVVKVTPIALGAPFLAVGSYSGTITFTPNVGSPQVITYTLNIVAASGEAEVNAPNAGYPVGCPSSTTGNTFNDKCTLQSPHMEPPSVCATYTDPNFGGTVKRVTPAGYAVEYGSITAFSASGTYLIASDFSGFIHAFRISDCMDMTGAVGGHGNIAYILTSALNDQVWYYYTGATIHRYNFITATDTTLGNYAGGAYGFTTLYAGGTQQSSVDDWAGFYDTGGGTTKLCAVNIPQLVSDGAPGGTNTYCRNIAGEGYSGGIDWVGVWGVDSGNGKRYVWLSAQPWSGLYSVGTAGVLNLENTGPTWAGFVANDDQEPCNASDAHCVSSQSFTHASIFRDANGRAQFYNSFQEPNANQVYAAFSAASKTTKMFRMAEEPNGGMYFSQINVFDEQPGASDVIGGIVTAPFMGSGLAFAAQITSATAANPAVLSVTNALSGPTHTVRVDVKDAGPWKTCLTGYWTATVTGSTLSLAGADCTGAGSFSGQVAIVGDAQNDIQTVQNAFLGQVVVIIPGHSVKQLAMHRSVGWSDVGMTGVNYYASTTKSSLSRDGSMVAWMSYFGTVDPNGPSVYIVSNPSVNFSGARMSGTVRAGGTPLVH